MNERTLKLAEFADSPEITQMESILDTQEQLIKSEQTIIDNLSQMTEFICNEIKPQDYSEELAELKSKLDEPQEIIVTLNII
jgi:hypothetical protein